MAEFLERATAIAQSAAKFSRKATKIITENTREFSFEGNLRYVDGPDEKIPDIRKKLEGNYADKDKAEAMKRIIAVYFAEY